MGFDTRAVPPTIKTIPLADASAVAGVTGAISVAVSAIATCAVTDSAKVFCWGGYDFPLTPRAVPELAGAAVVGLMGDGDLARAVCALRGNGTVVCVGPPAVARGLEARGHGLAFWLGDGMFGMQSFVERPPLGLRVCLKLG